MTAVVTGSAGFIGGRLVAELVRGGTDVVAVDRRPTPERAGVRVLRADLADPTPALQRALGEADVVFHLAARPGVRDSSPGIEEERYRDNVLATEQLLARVPLDVPLVVTSSSSVYGGSTGQPCHEDDELQPRGGYARSKVRMEEACRRRLDAGGIIAIARPFTVVGPGQRPDMALARWVDAVRLGLPVTVFGGRHRTRDVTDVDDVVRGLLGLAARRHCGVVNLGTGVAHPLGDLLDAVATAVGRAPVGVTVEPVPDGDVSATLAHTGRCAAVLGFVPRTDLAAVVARQVAAEPVAVAV